MKRLGGLYVELAASWLTPVEIFRPWYAHALARYILRQHQERCFAERDATLPLLVYEVRALLPPPRPTGSLAPSANPLCTTRRWTCHPAEERRHTRHKN